MWCLVDINSAFVNFVGLFMHIPEGVPAIVVSSNQGNVVARNAAVKELGVKMGQPLHEIEGLVRHHHGFIWGSNFALIGDISNRFHNEIEQGGWMYDCFPYSVDERFGRVNYKLMGDLEAHGRLLQKTLKRNIGLSVGVGIGRTKTLSKVANWAAKEKRWGSYTGGVVDLSAGIDRETKVLSKMPVSSVWGIGPRLRPKIEALGILTACDLRDSDPVEMGRLFNVNVTRTILELRGQESISMKDASAPRDSICVSKSMGGVVTDLGTLQEAVIAHASTAGTKLRRQASTAGAIQVFIGTSPFRKGTPQYSNSVTIRFIRPTESTEELVANAVHALKSIYRSGFEYKKAGVVLGAIESSAIQQPDLFEIDHAGPSALTTTLDLINDKYGRNTVRVGRVSAKPTWRPKDDLEPPSFTTRWEDLPVAR